MKPYQFDYDAKLIKKSKKKKSMKKVLRLVNVGPISQLKERVQRLLPFLLVYDENFEQERIICAFTIKEVLGSILFSKELLMKLGFPIMNT